MVNERMMRFEAPKGYVYDYKEPKYIIIDGEQVEEHLYAKYLFLTHLDKIDNYILVEDLKCQSK